MPFFFHQKPDIFFTDKIKARKLFFSTRLAVMLQLAMAKTERGLSISRAVALILDEGAF